MCPPRTRPGVDLLRLLDDESILDQLPDVLPGVGHRDLVDLIGVEPDLALAALEDAGASTSFCTVFA